MPVYRLGSAVPRIHPDAFVHPDAVVVGDVEIGAEASVWPAAVIRGDGGPIRIGARTSVQDGTVVHVTASRPTLVGDDCVIGHLAHLEACTVEDGCLLASGSVVLEGVVVGAGATVAANAVVLDGTAVPPGALAAGVPASVRPGRSRPEYIQGAVAVYLAKARRYRTELERIG